jgi:hypothetical protein
MTQFESDNDAFLVLDKYKITISRQGIIYLYSDEQYPDEVWQAVTYLRDEWDYDWTII